MLQLPGHRHHLPPQTSDKRAASFFSTAPFTKNTPFLQPYICGHKSSTMLQLANQTAFYKGKVRDVYTINDKYLAMVVSDRIAAFDVVLPRPIPYKGAVLNQIAAIMLRATEDIVPNWVISVPLP